VRTPSGGFRPAIALIVLGTVLPGSCGVACAVPASAVETGQPCAARHIGVTRFRLAFKVDG